jgi:hypothetical protein
MPAMYFKHHFSTQQSGVMQCAAKLSMPVCNAAKAKTGIRTHVFEPEENKAYKKYQKVRSNYT